ncbi:MAG: SprB repeat-containing protein [Bacteroidetes bacterium]|nr:SprB repeat-containing protein [Bacteroidota bacterium]
MNTIYSVTAVGNGCSNQIGSAAISILAPPTISTSTNAPLCEGTNLSLNASGGVSYVWSGPSFTSSAQNPNINAVTQGTGGNYTVVVTDAFGCTNSEVIVVDVYENPVVSVVSQTNVTCNGGNDGDLVITATGGTGFYQYSAASTSNFDGLFPGLLAGNYTIEAVDGNGCISTSATTITEPDPTTVSQAGADAATCFGVSTTLNANAAVIGVGSWSLISGNAIFTDSSNPLTEINGLNVGPNVLRWTVDNGVCGSNFDEVTVSGTALPVAQISGSPIICNGQSTSLNVSFTGTGPWTYSYTDGTTTFGPFTTNNSNDNISVAPTSNKTYSITAVNDASCTGSGTGSASVIVNTGLPTNTIYSSGFVAPISACTGNVINVACNTVGNVNGYTWSTTSGTLIDGQTGPFTTLNPNATLTLGALPANSSGWRACVFASNACGSSNQLCLFVRGALSLPAALAGAAVACEGTTGSYSTLPVAGADGYAWTATGGVNVLSGNGTTAVTVSFDPGFTQERCVSLQIYLVDLPVLSAVLLLKIL